METGSRNKRSKLLAAAIVYKHIAIPTDGSKLARKGVKAGMKLAQSLGAKVTGVYVIPPYSRPVCDEAALYYIPGMSPREYRKKCGSAAEKALAEVEIEARSAGVPCATRVVTSTQPYKGILRAARAAKCDAIAMSSHGRGAVAGVFLGSETSHVLAYSKLPVLVTR
jgi:nucleotide-binding universal stress UspA family protein